MKIESTKLKELSRKLRGIGGELFNFNGTQAHSKVDNLDVIVDFSLDCAAPFAVSAEKFSQVVARLDGDVDFSIVDGKAVLKSKKSKLTLPITEPRPAFKIPTTETISVPREETLTALNFAMQACVRSLMQSYSGAVSFSKRCAAGSDGFRLSVSLTGVGPEVAYILPAPAVESLKVFDAPQFDIGQDEQNVYFIGGGTTIVARRYVRSFPAFEKLIPTSTNLNFEFKREDVLTALKSLQPLAEEKSKINLTCEGDNGIISLTSQIGSGDVSIPVVGGEVFSPTFSTSLPFDFVIEFVESVKSPAIKMGCNSEKGPFLLEAEKFKLIIAGSR